MSYNDFTDMPVWQRALEIGEDVYKLTVGLPKSEDYGLTSQLRRASVSISGNIAEGFGRTGSKDKAKFYDYSRGSAFETSSLLIYGKNVGYFDEKAVELIIIKSKSVIHDLNKIKSILRKKFEVKGYVSEDFEIYGLTPNLYESNPQPHSHSQPQPDSQSDSQSQPQSQSTPQP